MNGVLEKQLALAVDRRLQVFAGQAASGALLGNDMELRAAACLISDIVMPCCCMMCSIARLESMLRQTSLCQGSPELAARLARLVYDDLARCNGLG